jgi:hypothetical protein
MDWVIVTMRVVHVVLGVFWAGTLIFVALFLVPAVREAGPEGARVMAAIQRRRFLDVMPLVALATLLSGLWLYWRMSAGFRWGWMTTPMGSSLGIGGLSATLAFIIGVGVMRPATLQAGALARDAAEMPDGPERAARMAQVQALRGRSVRAGRVVAVLLALATALMAVARYL